MKNKLTIWIIGLIFLASAVHAQVGAVLDLDGSGDTVNIPASVSSSITQNITAEAWVNVGASQTGLAGTEGSDKWMLYSNDNSYGPPVPSFWVKTTDNDWAVVDCDTNIIGVGWVHLVGTYTSGNLSIYYNGKLISSSGVVTGDLASEPGMINVMGARHTGNDNYFVGKIDEVKIYNRTLSPEEVNNSYERGLQHLSSNNSNDQLFGYWPFDGDAKDYSGKGNNGTFNGDAHLSSFIIGNSSNVTTSGITSLNVTIAGSTLLNGTYTGVKALEVKDGTNLIFNLNHNFTKSLIDLTKVSITKSGNDIVFNMSNMFSAGDIHSFYVPNNGYGLYYCPYAKTISDVSLGCSNAVSFTNEEAVTVTQKTIVGGIAAGSWVNASISGNYYKIMTNSTADDGGGGNPTPPVPEFSAITTITALAVVLSGFFMMRNKTR